jgi:TfoX/Sxy family transcriptional regulator of competence genes
MAWVKVPPENHPIFYDALPKDPRVETMKLFGGVGAKVNGNFFAGLFARSVMVWLPDAERDDALALEGASYFDPMGDGRMRSDKVMLPEAMMEEPEELRRWLARSFAAAAALPRKSKAGKSAKAKPKAAGRSKAKPASARRPKR